MYLLFYRAISSNVLLDLHEMSSGSLMENLLFFLPTKYSRILVKFTSILDISPTNHPFTIR